MVLTFSPAMTPGEESSITNAGAEEGDFALEIASDMLTSIEHAVKNGNRNKIKKVNSTGF
ncbi:MAG: hypothetical protein ACXVCY_15545 [Pseudobdellovibrionaceae bacterium]